MRRRGTEYADAKMIAQCSTVTLLTYDGSAHAPPPSSDSISRSGTKVNVLPPTAQETTSNSATDSSTVRNRLLSTAMELAVA